MEVILTPIEVVAVFSREGRISPLRFRIILDESGYQTIIIDKITRRRRERIGKSYIDIYTCTGIVSGTVRHFELKHEITTGEWALYRM